MNKEQLIEKLQGLGGQAPEGATNDQLEDLIKIAEHPVILKQRDDALKKVEALEKKLQKGSKSNLKVLAKHKFEDGVTMGLTNDSIIFKGQKLTAEKAVKNADLMNALRANKSVHLVKV